MRRRQTAGFGSHAAHVNSGFDGALQRGCHRFGRHGAHGLRRVIAYGFITHFGNAQAGQARLHQHQIDAVAGIAGARFKISGQTVAHTGGEKARRLGGQQFGVGQHGIGVIRQEKIAVKRAVGIVNHGQRGAGRIGGSQRGENHHRHVFVVSYGFGGVERFAAADAHHKAAAGLVEFGLLAVDFFIRRFAAKHGKHAFHAVFSQARF